MKEFSRYHIPAATMKRKADEFRALQQGSMSVEQYTYQFMELAFTDSVAVAAAAWRV